MQYRHGLATIAYRGMVDGIGLIVLSGVMTPTAAPELRRDVVAWARQEGAGALLMDVRGLCLGVTPSSLRQHSSPSVELKAPVAILADREHVAPWRVYCESRAADALVRGVFTELGRALEWARAEARVHQLLRRPASAPACR